MAAGRRLPSLGVIGVRRVQVVHQHRLDELTVAQPEEVLAGQAVVAVGTPGSAVGAAAVAVSTAQVVAVASIASWPDSSTVGDGVTPGGSVAAGSLASAVTSAGPDDLERVQPEANIRAKAKIRT